MHQETLNPQVIDKWDQLIHLFKQMNSVVVAFSGGVDSGLLAAAAYEALGDRMLAVTIHSEVESEEGIEVARLMANQIGFSHKIIEHDDLSNPNFKSNPVDRCYHCKLNRFTLANHLALEQGYQWVVEGSNASDIGDYRPGMRAVQELGVRSPLVEVGLSKSEIRQLAKWKGLPNWDRPSAPCLATRFPYGTEITLENIQKVSKGETFLKSMGIRQLRVRYHGSLARIEVLDENIELIVKERVKILDFFKKLGFIYIAVDLAGFRSGSMNEEI